MKLRFLMDENLGFKVFQEVKATGYDVKSVLDVKRGATDEEVIQLAKDEGRIIITLDKDFGLLALKYSLPGLIVLRLQNQTVELRTKVIKRLLWKHSGQLPGKIIIVSETSFRMRAIK